ncbi:hypothetical protein SAMN06265375_10387 [Muriicola jejuensis]|nr:hypothetical protein SAMN06265375_10387 [Muriicola jejuensis]
MKISFYGLVILCLLEILVRVFHLYKDTPSRMIDDYGVEKWVPNQTGYCVTGNRRQNVGKYRINSSGFNSYREFEPTEYNFELALIGDSFIEGFHQDYDKSIGKILESKLPGVIVYEFGYAGYDLASEFHLLNTYDSIFNKIDKIVIYLDYPDDLKRDNYSVSRERLRLESGVFRMMKQSKLLVYTQNIGLLGVPINSLSYLKTMISKILMPDKHTIPSEMISVRSNEDIHFRNFKMLWETQANSKEKIMFLIDRASFPKSLQLYFQTQKIQVIDYGIPFEYAEKPVTLIYDQHWNSYGRELVSQAIADQVNLR